MYNFYSFFKVASNAVYFDLKKIPLKRRLGEKDEKTKMPNAWDVFVSSWTMGSSPLGGPSPPHIPPGPQLCLLPRSWREKGLKGGWGSVSGITRYVGPCVIAEKGPETVS